MKDCEKIIKTLKDLLTSFWVQVAIFYLLGYYSILRIIDSFGWSKESIVLLSAIVMHSLVTIAFAKFLKDLLLART